MPANDLGLDYGPQPEHLTRREQFAMAAMGSAMVAMSAMLRNQETPKVAARLALDYADALIAELDKFNKKPA